MALSSEKVFAMEVPVSAEENALLTVDVISDIHEEGPFNAPLKHELAAVLVDNTDIFKDSTTIILIDDSLKLKYICADDGMLNEGDYATVFGWIDAYLTETREEDEQEAQELAAKIKEIILRKQPMYLAATKDSDKMKAIKEAKCLLKVELGIDGRNDNRASDEYIKMLLNNEIK